MHKDTNSVYYRMLVSEVNYDSINEDTLQEYPEHIRMWIAEFYLPSVRYVDGVDPERRLSEALSVVTLENISVLRNPLHPQNFKVLWTLLLEPYMIIGFTKDQGLAQYARDRLLQFAAYKVPSSWRIKNYVYAMCGETLDSLQARLHL